MSQPAERFEGLEVDEDMSFQRRAWAVQRVGRALIGLVVLAALAGAFGHGPLSRTTAGRDSADLRVEYDRFMRYTGDESMLLQLGPGAAKDGEARVSLSRAFVEAVNLEHVTPEPERVESAPQAMTFVFNVTGAAGTGAGQSVPIIFHLRPERVGRLSAEVALNGGEPVRFSAFVYP